MNDQQLMAKIKAEMVFCIRQALLLTPGAIVSESFIAALVANESGGDSTAKRFEPTVFVDLGLVLAGRKPAYHSLGAQDLTPMLTRAGLNGNPLQAVTNKIMDLATSWGATQIMGWQSIDLSLTVDDLKTPSTHFPACTRLLAKGIKDFKIPADSYEPLFRWWNTGEPDGKTDDPNYVGKGLNRMHIYEALP